MSIFTSTQQLLNQLKELIEQMSEEDFCQPLSVLSNASIGQHIRHTLEFFICLIDASNNGEINYDNRMHDEVIERDKNIAISFCQSVIDFLAKHPEDFELKLKANYHIDFDETLTVRSSFYRELAYNIEHAIHHMALIKIGIKTFPGNYTLPEHFGVASSTVRYKLKKSS